MRLHLRTSGSRVSVLRQSAYQTETSLTPSPTPGSRSHTSALRNMLSQLIELPAAGQGVGVVGAEYALSVGEGLLVQGDGLIDPSRIAVGGGEIAAAGQGVGVVGAEMALIVGEDLLVQGDGLIDPPRSAVGGGQIVTAVQGLEVVGAEHLLALV